MLTRKASAPASANCRIILGVLLAGPSVARMRTLRLRGTNWLCMVSPVGVDGGIATIGGSSTGTCPGRLSRVHRPPRDRKSFVSGKSVAVRVDLGGRRNIKKKKKIETRIHTH